MISLSQRCAVGNFRSRLLNLANERSESCFETYALIAKRQFLCRTYSSLKSGQGISDSTPTLISDVGKIEKNAIEAGSQNCMVLYDSLSCAYKTVPMNISVAPGAEDNHRQQEDLTPSKGLAWYTCGPTVYDSAHLGHARTYVSLDIIHRILLHLHRSYSNQNTNRSLPPPPIFIMNITDVDDKILQRAKETNTSPIQLARKFESEFWADMEQLNVMRPTVVTRVTEHVTDSIVPYIERILENGLAYIIADEVAASGDDEHCMQGSVYFDVGAFETAQGRLNKYGKLAPPSAASENILDTDDGQAGDRNTFFKWENKQNDKERNGTKEESLDQDARINIERKDNKKIKKRDPRDFVLWKSRKDGEEELCWDSPWGSGRPGWHIECSAMIESTMQLFANSYELHVHAGGVDLKFPHHTNEIAQAEAYNSNDVTRRDKEWIPHWIHTGHLYIRGMKMSKSLKNFITIRDFLSSVNEDGDTKLQSLSAFDSIADDFRLWCLGLSGSYRGPATYSEARIEEAKITREKIIRFLIDGEKWIRESSFKIESEHIPPGRWTSDDLLFLDNVNRYHAECNRSLMGSSQALSGFDFDGYAFLQALLSLAEAGNAHINSVEVGSHAIEPIQRALQLLRENLSLVGFSRKTVEAGIGSYQTSGNNVAGGEYALVEELVKFRSDVRNMAIDRINSADIATGDKSMLNEILGICDEVRDVTLPSIGIEIFDDKSESYSEEKGSKSWRFCSPRINSKSSSCSSETNRKVSKVSTPSMHNISSEDFFKLGHYEGMFSKYDSKGLPTHDVAGNEVSKRLRKKLLKKREKLELKINKNK